MRLVCLIAALALAGCGRPSSEKYMTATQKEAKLRNELIQEYQHSGAAKYERKEWDILDPNTPLSELKKTVWERIDKAKEFDAIPENPDFEQQLAELADTLSKNKPVIVNDTQFQFERTPTKIDVYFYDIVQKKLSVAKEKHAVLAGKAQREIKRSELLELHRALECFRKYDGQFQHYLSSPGSDINFIHVCKTYQLQFQLNADGNKVLFEAVIGGELSDFKVNKKVLSLHTEQSTAYLLNCGGLLREISQDTYTKFAGFLKDANVKHEIFPDRRDGVIVDIDEPVSDGILSILE
ncbi:hypothetical protein HY486_00575 [Candidatus Woesearchaeota archaeon]|nr:hypothetical protein [Candidatus Woesearchaeota archaeon]